jgi:hypothetical protein
MKTYLLHAYTTDSVESVIIDRTGVKPEAVLIDRLLETSMGKELLSWCPREKVFLTEQPLLEFFS